jgi:hypothetical protein
MRGYPWCRGRLRRTRNNQWSRQAEPSRRGPLVLPTTHGFERSLTASSPTWCMQSGCHSLPAEGSLQMRNHMEFCRVPISRATVQLGRQHHMCGPGTAARRITSRFLVREEPSKRPERPGQHCVRSPTTARSCRKTTNGCVAQRTPFRGRRPIRSTASAGSASRPLCQQSSTRPW